MPKFDTLFSRITATRLQRETLLVDIQLAEQQQAISNKVPSQQNIINFSKLIQERLRSPDKAFAREYLRFFISHIEVDNEEVRIYGSKEVLAADVERTKEIEKDKVLTFVREWRPWWDKSGHFLMVAVELPVRGKKRL